MIVFTQPLALFLALPVLATTLGLWRYGVVHGLGPAGRLGPGQGALALIARLSLLGSIILALAGFALRLPESRQAVVFVSDLSASDARSQGDMQELMVRALQQGSSEDRAGIVTLGRQALVEQSLSSLHAGSAAAGRLGELRTQVDPNYSNLEGGLELAGALFPDGYRRRVVLLSDGQQNIGDALGAARLLRSERVRVDVAPLGAVSGPDVLVDGVDIPPQIRPQETFSLSVALRSNVTTRARVDIYRDDHLLLSRQERIHPGSQRFVFRQPPLRAGFHTYRVHITAAGDTIPQNNTGFAVTSAQGPQRVLVIAADRPEAVNIMDSLRTTGIPADLRAPWQVVPSLSYLEHYASVVIVNTPADLLGPALMGQLVPYVRDLGYGLVVTGGDESFGAGGYGQTPLEQALPVKMDLPKRKNMSSVAVALLIESLEVEQNINLSKLAGKGIVNLLTPQDQVAVNDTPDDGSTGWAVHLQYVTHKARIDKKIDHMVPGDPVSYVPYLQAAYQVLKGAHAQVKHIILLGDGDASDISIGDTSLTTYRTLAEAIHRSGITLSTVATDDELGLGEPGVMKKIALWGGGHFYHANSASRVPRIFLRDARTIARSGLVESTFYPKRLSDNPMLSGLRVTPRLYGYVATKPKATGELVLVSKKGDPVLAGWQFGLGRAVAWTSDAAGLWTRDWLQAPGANRFWANLVSWTLPPTQTGHLFVTSSASQGQGQISVETPSSPGGSASSPGSGTQLEAHVVDPSFHTATVQLQQNGPGRYRGVFDARTEGTYQMKVVARNGRRTDVAQVGVAVPYSAEYRTMGTNLSFLRSLAAAGGGSIIHAPGDVWRDNLAAASDQRSLSGPLWLLALLLLPVDIAMRRIRAISF